MQTMKIRGLRGVVDRRTEHIDPNWKPTKRIWKRGHFALENFQLFDAMITYHQTNPNEPSIPIVFSQAHFKPLRRQWLLYDVLNGEAHGR